MVRNPPASTGDRRDMDSTPGSEDPWGRKWQPTLVFLPGEFHGQSLFGRQSMESELHTTEPLSIQL